MRELPLLSFLGIRSGAAEPGTYVAELDATAATLNRQDVVHGAAIAALIDHAGGYGARVLTNRVGLTSDLHVRFLGAAAEGGMLRAEARVQRAGRALVVMEVRVTDQDGRLIAVGDMALVPVDQPSA